LRVISTYRCKDNHEFIRIRRSDPHIFVSSKNKWTNIKRGSPVGRYPIPVESYYSQPLNVKIETKYTRAAPGGTGYAKAAGNYAGSLYPTKLAAEEGYHQLLWTDGVAHEYIEESGTMNIMFVIDDVLVTPQTSDSILDGITRKSVVTLAEELGYKVEKRRISVSELIDALKANRVQEAFGVGTAATISPIKMIGHKEQQFELPMGDENKLSTRILQILDEIRYGAVEDKHGWIMKI
jgi:branched-chain amino acid aminotransferase